MSPNSSMNYMVNVLHVSFPWNTNKIIIIPLNTILVLYLHLGMPLPTHRTIWSGNSRNNENVQKILLVHFQWVPSIIPPVHRFADTYNFNNTVYQPSEYRDQENTCCYQYHWLTEKMPRKWQKRVKKSIPTAFNPNSKVSLWLPTCWVNP